MNDPDPEKATQNKKQEKKIPPIVEGEFQAIQQTGKEAPEQMKKAYSAASKLLLTKMKKEAPEDYEILCSVKESDIIIVRGSYDHAETVFALTEIPFTVIDPIDVGDLQIRTDQILFINCPGSEIMPEGVELIRKFVKNGGYLITTDWALKFILEEAFSGIVKYTGNPTPDDVVRIEILDPDNVFVQGLLTEKSEPVWWLEGQSYPIQILDKNKVKVLITSKELEKKYGEAPVAITFPYGYGRVFHMISHFYLQRTETRSKRQKLSSFEYATEQGLMKEEVETVSELQALTVGEVESAFTSTKFMQNIILDKKKQVQSKKEEEKEEEEP